MSTNFLKLGLVPVSGLDYWHSLDSYFASANGLNITSVPDYSGNNRTLTCASNYPTLDRTAIKTNLFSTLPGAYFDGTKNPLRHTASSVLLKHIFMLVKVDVAAFTGNEGLLSDTGSNNILAGNGAASTKFLNLLLGINYQKNGVSYLESNLQAPMKEYGLIEIQASSGLSMVGLQIGQQLGGSAAKFKGWWFEHLAYSRVLTETERQRVLMYFHLKFGTQKYGSNQLYFPSDNFLDFRRSRFYAEPPDYGKITDSYEFEDGGRTFNETADGAPRRWQYEYLGRTPDQVAIFDEFYNQTRLSGKFKFTDKYGETFDNVQIESYNRSHEAHKSWRNDAKFVLVKYP